MKHKNIHEFDPIIYPYKLWVVIDKEPSIIAEKFNEYSGNAILFNASEVDRSEAFAMPVCKKANSEVPSRYGVVIFFRSKQSMTYELVSHESSHAAKYLFDHIGASVKEHEPFEYVVGWMAGCCDKARREK